MASARRSGARPPAAVASHASEAPTTPAYAGAAALSAANAAQQSAVVLMLLLLLTVSPHPPSAFWLSASQFRPARINSPQRRSLVWMFAASSFRSRYW